LLAAADCGGAIVYNLGLGECGKGRLNQRMRTQLSILSSFQCLIRLA
jgi:hypothetical protein